MKHRLPVLAAITISVAAALPGPPSMAHSLGYTRAAVVFHADGSYEMDLYYEIGNLLFGPDHGGLNSTELYDRLSDRAAAGVGLREELRQRIRDTVELRFDGHPARFQISFPELDAGIPPRRGALPGSHALLQGQVPARATTFVMQLDRVYGDILGAIRAGREGPIQRRVMPWGEASEPYFLRGDGGQSSPAAVAARYLGLGFTHILPLGLDHILFVLGLYLLTTRLRALLVQVTAFTLAHSVTLALSMYGWLSLPSSLVEPLIALSIAYVAIENIVTTQLKPWRPAVVFGFGLLHGLGFAGVLRDLGLPRADYATALVTFNVGVEFGQVAVLALAFALSGWFRSRSWYRLRLAIPASTVIAAVALYWMVERIFFI
ncbi:MAG: HupE/UreJ family protein [Acidobacteria bacterium]|nr:HupE/UreJ family protein [Acidobacteriota bacterium]